MRRRGWEKRSVPPPARQLEEAKFLSIPLRFVLNPAEHALSRALWCLSNDTMPVVRTTHLPPGQLQWPPAAGRASKGRSFTWKYCFCSEVYFPFSKRSLEGQAEVLHNERMFPPWGMGGRKCDPRVLSQPSAKPVEGCLPYKINGFEKNHLLSVSSSFLPGPHSIIIPSAYAQVFSDLQNQEISQQRTLFNFLNKNFSSFLSLGTFSLNTIN